MGIYIIIINSYESLHVNRQDFIKTVVIKERLK